MRYSLLALLPNNRTCVVAKASTLRQAAALVRDSFNTGEVSKVRDNYYGILWNVEKDGFGATVYEVQEALRDRLQAKRNKAERKAGLPETSFNDD